MERPFRQLSLALVLLALPATTRAEHPADPVGVRVGVGLPVEVADSLGFLGYLGYSEDIARYEILFDTTDIRVPILMSGLRIEPEIGFSRLVFDDDEWSAGTTSSFKIGSSVAKVWTVGKMGSAYAGGHVSLLRLAHEDEEDEVQTDLLLGAVAGGEVWPAPSFSFGGEVSLDYVRFHEDEEWLDSAIGTRASLVARFYFN